MTMDDHDLEDRMTPRTLLSWLARAEALTWALLLLGMALKYVTQTTDLGVRVFGLVHGVVFLAFALVALLLRVDQRWAARTTLLVLGAAVVPFATLWVERAVERGALARGTWRLAPGGDEPRTASENLVAAALLRPAAAVVFAAAAVGITTLALLGVGPPQVPGQGA